LRPAHGLIGLDGVRERREFGLPRGSFCAAHQCISALDEKGVHLVRLDPLRCRAAVSKGIKVAFCAAGVGWIGPSGIQPAARASSRNRQSKSSDDVELTGRLGLLPYCRGAMRAARSRYGLLRGSVKGDPRPSPRAGSLTAPSLVAAEASWGIADQGLCRPSVTESRLLWVTGGAAAGAPLGHHPPLDGYPDP
jgi:hypothetical protein